MSPELKQYTAFTIGNVGFYECKQMPFGLCNTPMADAELSRQAQLDVLYHLLDDFIAFSKT